MKYSEIPICDDCSENTQKQTSISSIIQSCDKKYHYELFDLISRLIQFKSTSQDNIQHWRSILQDHFTHLHLIDHNIFSPNIINTEHVNGVFLSSRSVFQLLHSEDSQSSITYQLFTFFYDLLKFHIQYAQLNEKVSGQPDASITHQLNNFKKGMENVYCSLD